jgi:tripartite-type tricarboxylate transporter receptor subunit TctC
MNRQTRTAFLASLALAGAPEIVGSAVAQVYPSRPITIIVPIVAGGPADTLARIIANAMRVSLGQPVIIENIGGASGSIAAGRSARAAGDGYTLILGNLATHVANGAIYALPYDLLRDFEPISLIASQPLVIVAKKTIPAKDLNELIAWLKANPDTASQGTNGPGSAMHLAGVFFQKKPGTRFAFVPIAATPPQCRP